MASFPTSVYAPATKSAGQVIQASHINDPESEIVAIEDGYRNAKAPLNSSNSTLANLSVPGGSTLTTLSVMGNSTLASTITVGTLPYIFPAAGGSSGNALLIDSTNGSTMTLRWGTPSAAGQDAALVMGCTNGLASGGLTTLTWLHETTLSTSTWHSTSANPERLNIPSSGTYLVGLHVVFGGVVSSVGYREVRINDDGANQLLLERHNAEQTGGVQAQFTVSGMVYLPTAGSYVVAQAIQNSGSTMSMNGGLVSGSRFWMTKLR